MRPYPLYIFCVLVVLTGFSSLQKNKKVKTIGVFENSETKSGYQINNYFVELKKEEFEKYKGKKVEVTGTLLIVPGLDPNEKVISQGSTSDRKFIVKYKVKILKN